MWIAWLASVGSLVIVHAGEEFRALDLATGEQVWATRLLSSYDAEMCGGDNDLLLAHKIKSPMDDNRSCPGVGLVGQFDWPDQSANRVGRSDRGAPAVWAIVASQ